ADGGVLPELAIARQLDERVPYLAERHQYERIGEHVAGDQLPHEDESQKAHDSAHRAERDDALMRRDARVDGFDGDDRPEPPQDRDDHVALGERPPRAAE